MHQLTRVLALELGPQRIAVNVIAPGPFPSRAMNPILATETEQYVSGTPLGRIGQESDIAGAVLFLSSRASAYISGAVIAAVAQLQAEGQRVSSRQRLFVRL